MRARKEMAGRKRNRTMCVLLSVLMLLLAACHGAEEGSGQSGRAEVEATIYADFSGGSETAQEDGLIRSMTMTVTEMTGQTLAECLSQWTGLDFTLNSAVVDGTTAHVDWAPDSTLIAGLDDREQKEDFFFFDEESLRCFMLDSLWRTLTENLDVTEVYYTMDGGEKLTLVGLNPVDTFPAEEPYKGSAFYFNQ